MKKNANTFKQFVMQFDIEFATEMYALSVDNSVDAFVTTLNFAI